MLPLHCCQSEKGVMTIFIVLLVEMGTINQFYASHRFARKTLAMTYDQMLDIERGQ